jgi:hypothetical protein
MYNISHPYDLVTTLALCERKNENHETKMCKINV